MPLILVTLGYLICFYLTCLVIFPIQNAVFGTIPLYASLLYLPHGVRVLTACFYGWKAPLLLAPATLQTHYYLSGWERGGGLDLLPVLSSVLCACVGFSVFNMVNKAFWGGQKNHLDWRNLLVIGVLASVLNALAVNLYHHELAPVEMLRAILAYLIGDISGLFFVMFLLMMSFRWARKSAEV